MVFILQQKVWLFNLHQRSKAFSHENGTPTKVAFASARKTSLGRRFVRQGLFEKVGQNKKIHFEIQDRIKV